MFDLLLQQDILLEQFHAQLKRTCLDMIRVWSQSVLLTWINVFMRLKPTKEEFQALTTDMSQRNQPESVRCGCLLLLSKQQETGLDFDASKVAHNLLFDFNWMVRKTLAEYLPKIKVD